MYRIARNYDGLRTRQPWDWYLERAVRTTLQFGCWDDRSQSFSCIPSVGVMDGTVFRELLLDLTAEGTQNSTWAQWAQAIGEMMLKRTVTGIDGQPGWNDLPAPFGSESVTELTSFFKLNSCLFFFFFFFFFKGGRFWGGPPGP